jgi:hypothetical protein
MLPTTPGESSRSMKISASIPFSRIAMRLSREEEFTTTILSGPAFARRRSFLAVSASSAISASTSTPVAGSSSVSVSGSSSRTEPSSSEASSSGSASMNMGPSAAASEPFTDVWAAVEAADWVSGEAGRPPWRRRLLRPRRLLFNSRDIAFSH